MKDLNNFRIIVKHINGISKIFDVPENTTIKKIRYMAIKKFNCSKDLKWHLECQGKYIGKNSKNIKPEITDKNTVKEFLEKHKDAEHLSLTIY